MTRVIFRIARALRMNAQGEDDSGVKQFFLDAFNFS